MVIATVREISEIIVVINVFSIFKKSETNVIVYPMRTCSLCGKGTVILRNRSHAQNRTPKAYKANIQKVTLDLSGDKVSGYFCTKCIKRLKKEVKPQAVKE